MKKGTRKGRRGVAGLATKIEEIRTLIPQIKESLELAETLREAEVEKAFVGVDPLSVMLMLRLANGRSAQVIAKILWLEDGTQAGRLIQL